MGAMPTALQDLASSTLKEVLSVGLAASGVSGPLAPLRRRALTAIFASDASLRLQFPREDLGFVYGPGAGPETPSPEKPPLNVADRAVRSSVRDLEFVPALRVGGRMPHAEVCIALTGSSAGDQGAARGQCGCGDVSGRCCACSVLDLVPRHGPAFLLVLPAQLRAAAWAAAAARVSATLCPVQMLGMRALSVGAQQEESQALRLEPCAGLGEMLTGWYEGGQVLQCRDVRGHWRSALAESGLGADAGIVVRPDGHIAAIFDLAEAAQAGDEVDTLWRIMYAALLTP